jgi:hypothetical protein
MGLKHTARAGRSSRTALLRPLVEERNTDQAGLRALTKLSQKAAILEDPAPQPQPELRPTKPEAQVRILPGALYPANPAVQFTWRSVSGLPTQAVVPVHEAS